MKKSIVTIVAFMLFALAGFAQGGERVYIRVFNYLGSTEVYISEKGVVNHNAITGMFSKSGRIENLKEFSAILEGYYNKGFEVKLVTNLSTGASVETVYEYILQKD